MGTLGGPHDGQPCAVAWPGILSLLSEADACPAAVPSCCCVHRFDDVVRVLPPAPEKKRKQLLELDDSKAQQVSSRHQSCHLLLYLSLFLVTVSTAVAVL